VIHEGTGRLIEDDREIYYVLREYQASIPTGSFDDESNISGESSMRGVIRASGSPLSMGTYTLQLADGRKIKLIVEELIFHESARVRATGRFF
jgi:hypothetical protein